MIEDESGIAAKMVQKTPGEIDPNRQIFSPPRRPCNSNSNSKVFDASTSCCATTNSADVDVRSLLLREADYDIDNPPENNSKKRQGYITWDDYFMSISYLSAQRSKDPHEQHGACIVDQENRIVGIGYNGFPRGCSDDCLPWANEHGNDKDDVEGGVSNILHTKHPFMCHAEVNAIQNRSSHDVKGTRMFVAQIPSNECAKMIIQAGISEIVYMRDKEDDDSARASRILFRMAGVKLRKHSSPNVMKPLDFSLLSSGDVDDNQEGGQDSFPHTLPSPPPSSPNNDIDVDPRKQYQELLMREANFDPTNNERIQKRQEYLTWDDYFTAVAYLSARRSKDPNTQVGACIVDANKCIVGIGYNGFPRGCSDDHLPWSRTGESDLHKKYVYVVHAEVNAILNKGSKDLKGATIYVALFPCCECTKVIIQAGIKEVVYLSDVYHDTDSCRASRIMLEMAGVRTRRHIPSKKLIEINFSDDGQR